MNARRPDPVRHRLRHGKTGLARFVSHIDLIHYFSRLMARARVPLSFTEGFNPKPKFEFGPALSTGIESLCEYVDFFLDAPAEPDELLPALVAAGVPDLAVTEAFVAPPGKLSRALVASRFRVEVASPAGEGPLSAFLAAASPAALESSAIAAPGFVTEVALEKRDGDGAVLHFSTRHIDGRALSPKLLEKLPEAAPLSFRYLKTLVRFAP